MRVSPRRHSRGRTGSVLLAAMVVCLSSCGDDDPTGAEPRVIDVEVVNFRYEPALVNARVGDTIRWTQRDAVPHTATSRDPAPSEPGGFNEEGLVEPGDVVQVELTTAGTIEYFCVPHPFMEGSIIVSR